MSPARDSVAGVIEIDAGEARRLRARAQLLGGSELGPSELVARAGAMQGQDLGGVLRAIALRAAPGTTREAVRGAFDRGELVRGWPMRGTLFAIAPDDLADVVAVTGPRMQTSLRARRSNLGITDADFGRAKEIAVEALAPGPQPRAELEARWRDAGLLGDQALSYHFVSTLAIEGVLALGPFAGKDQLLVRLPASLAEPAVALARIARKFFAARGPATIDDLAWWTKLPKSLLAPAVAAVDGLEEIRVDGRTMHVLDDGVGSGELPAVALVPAFDEWILGYADRSLVASAAAMREVATVNGIFRPAVLVDGVVVGRWGKGVLELVEPVRARQRKAIEAAVAAWPHG